MNVVSNDGRSGLLSGKVALVVGASRGIGAVSARALADTAPMPRLAPTTSATLSESKPDRPSLDTSFILRLLVMLTGWLGEIPG